MEDWSKNFFEIFDEMAADFEQFFQEVGELVEMVVDEINETILLEVDQYLEDIFDPIVEIYYEEEIFNDSDFLITYKEEPSLNKHPACMGCQHYHGHVYGGNLLVCGMHPYGWDGNTCPDWEREQSPF